VAGESPTAFDAIKVTEYAVPSDSPWMVALLADAFAVVVVVFLPFAVAVSR
jgi:hypothetical protein